METGDRDFQSHDMIIGVTGHRFLTDIDRLDAGISTALLRVEQVFSGRFLTLLSPLAEGADRVVARKLLERPGARVIVVLPLVREDYMTDFASPESKAEFLRLMQRAAEVKTLQPTATRNAAYEAVGRYIVDHCDVLLALWDGQETHGQGGTADVVAYARSLGRPVLIVRAGNRKPGTEEATSLGEEQGKVIEERLAGI